MKNGRKKDITKDRNLSIFFKLSLFFIVLFISQIEFTIISSWYTK